LIAATSGGGLVVGAIAGQPLLDVSGAELVPVEQIGE
jgi:hypothetical protein